MLPLRHRPPRLLYRPRPAKKVSDIEELVSLAKQHEFCPFYLGRGQAPGAELVLMPYNYLLDPGTRRGIKVKERYVTSWSEDRRS